MTIRECKKKFQSIMSKFPNMEGKLYPWSKYANDIGYLKINGHNLYTILYFIPKGLKNHIFWGVAHANIKNALGLPLYKSVYSFCRLHLSSDVQRVNFTIPLCRYKTLNLYQVRFGTFPPWSFLQQIDACPASCRKLVRGRTTKSLM